VFFVRKFLSKNSKSEAVYTRFWKNLGAKFDFWTVVIYSSSCLFVIASICASSSPYFSTQNAADSWTHICATETTWSRCRLLVQLITPPEVVGMQWAAVAASAAWTAELRDAGRGEQVHGRPSSRHCCWRGCDQLLMLLLDAAADHIAMIDTELRRRRHWTTDTGDGLRLRPTTLNCRRIACNFSVGLTSTQLLGRVAARQSDQLMIAINHTCSTAIRSQQLLRSTSHFAVVRLSVCYVQTRITRKQKNVKNKTCVNVSQHRNACQYLDQMINIHGYGQDWACALAVSIIQKSIWRI